MDKNGCRKKISITHALLLTFIPLLALSIVFILFIIRDASQKSLYSVAKETMSRNLDWTERYVGSMVAPAQEIGSYISHHIYNKDAVALDDLALSDVMLERLKYSPHLYSLYVGRPDGSFVLAGWRPRKIGHVEEWWLYIHRIRVDNGQRVCTETWVNPEDFSDRHTQKMMDDPYDPRVRPWYRKVAAEARDSWTAPYIFYTTQKAGITFASPVFDPSGEIQGIVGVDLRLETLAKFLDENKFSSHSVSFIFTDQGDILSHPNLINQLKINEIPSLETMDDPILQEGFQIYRKSQKYRSGERLFTVIPSDQGPQDIIFKVTNNAEGRRLIIGEHVPESDYLASLQSTNRQAFLSACTMLFVAVIAGIIFARRMADPIRNLSLLADKVKALDFSAIPTRTSCLLEIHQTIDSFDGMMKSLQDHRIQNDLLTEKLNKAHLDTLYRLAMAAECRDSGTAAHLDRVAGISALIGEGLGMGGEDIEVLRHASIMHDVGKLSIPDNILLKREKLSTDEWEVIQRHTVLGAKILEKASSEIMEKARIIALTHHEKWDGSGYPRQLCGENIPLLGRIVAVADVFDALLSERSYKKKYSAQKALAIVQQASGQHFDPQCIKAFESRLDDILALYPVDTAM